MSNEAKHTPGPWQKLTGGPDWSPVIGSDGRLVAQPHPRDADFIVEACNNYDRLKEEKKALLEALDKLLEVQQSVLAVEGDGWHAHGTQAKQEAAMQAARAAIAKAEKGA